MARVKSYSEVRVPLAERYGPPMPPEMVRELAERWYQDNKEAFDAYNERVRKHGVLLAKQGTW